MRFELVATSLLVASATAELLDPAKYTFSNNAFAVLTFEDGFTPLKGPSDLVKPYDYPASQETIVEKDGRNVLKIEPGMHPVQLLPEYFQLGKQDFTIEFDYKRDKNAGNAWMFEMLSTGVGYMSPDLLGMYTEYLRVKGQREASSGRFEDCDWSQWNRIAVSRQGTNWGLFVNGIQRIHQYVERAEDIADINPAFVQWWTRGDRYGVTGWVDNFEYSKFAKYEIGDLRFASYGNWKTNYAVLTSAAGGASPEPPAPTRAPTKTPTKTPTIPPTKKFLLDPAKYTFSNNAFAVLTFEDGFTPLKGPSSGDDSGTDSASRSSFLSRRLEETETPIWAYVLGVLAGLGVIAFICWCNKDGNGAPIIPTSTGRYYA